MKLFLSVISISISSVVFAQTLTVNDLMLLSGSWKGKLTYLDYNTANPFNMPANIHVTHIPPSDQFIVAISYPDEPGANTNDTFFISQGGKVFNNSNIIKLKRLKNGGVIITTEKQGQDGNDNKAALLKHIYTIKKNSFTNRKEVKYFDEKKWLFRNEYKFYR